MMSLEKTNKRVKFQILKHFCFLLRITRERVCIETHRTESGFVIEPGKYTLFRRVCALFNPEILQAWAAKGLSLSVFFFALACERTFIKTHSIQNRRYRTETYTVWRRVRASFSPEILQAGAVKGLSNQSVLRCIDRGEEELSEEREKWQHQQQNNNNNNNKDRVIAAVSLTEMSSKSTGNAAEVFILTILRIQSHKRFKTTLIYYDRHTICNFLGEIPFVKLQNDTGQENDTSTQKR